MDVFLFISAFLLSLSFMRKINEGKALNLLAYWTHVFARLLPAAAVVIVLTLAASLTILPALYWNARAVDAQASLFYYQNWNLANGAVNYFAQGISDKSPFQHFWSFSIQGQIFLLWPILFVSCASGTFQARTRGGNGIRHCIHGLVCFLNLGDKADFRLRIF